MNHKLLVTIFSLLMIGAGGVQSADEAAPQPSPPSDAQIVQKIVGSWLLDISSPSGASLKGVETFLAGGKYMATFKITGNKGEVNGEYGGTWQVKNGVLITTVTESSAPKLLAVGHVGGDKIIRVDDQVWVYQKENGSTETRKRAN